jgi:hypothetical protein
MTKLNIIDSVFEMLGALSDKVDKQLVEIAINDAYNQIVYDIVRSGKNDFDLCRKTFTGISVTWDTAGAVYYSSFPKSIVPNINTEMIVQTIQGSDLRFSPTTEQGLQLTVGSVMDGTDNGISYILKRERIEFYNMESLSQDEIDNGSSPTPRVPTIKMNLAIQFKEFDNTDEVYFPMGRDYEIKQLALDYLNKEKIIQIRND